jgi:hypothetical protein
MVQYCKSRRVSSMTLPEDPRYKDFLRFLQEKQRTSGIAMVVQNDAMAYLETTDEEEYRRFIKPLVEAKMMGNGTGTIVLDWRGEDAILTPEEVAERAQLKERLHSYLHEQVHRQAHDEIRMDQIVDEVTGNPGLTSSRMFTSTKNLSHEWGVDVYAIRAVGKELIRDGVAEEFSSGKFQDDCSLRLLPEKHETNKPKPE